MEFIKSFKNNIRKLPAVNQLAIRNRSLNIMNNLPSYSVVTPGDLAENPSS